MCWRLWGQTQNVTIQPLKSINDISWEAGPGTSPVRVTGWGRLWRTWFTCLPSKVFLWILINLLHHSHLLTASEFFTEMDHCFWGVPNFISDQPTWKWYLMAKFTRLTTLWCVFTWVYHVQHVSASRYLHLGYRHDSGNHHMIYPEMGYFHGVFGLTFLSPPDLSLWWWGRHGFWHLPLQGEATCNDVRSKSRENTPKKILFTRKHDETPWDCEDPILY